MGILRQLVFYVPVMLTLPRLLGVRWFYFGSTGIDIVIALFTFTLFARVFKSLREKAAETPPAAASAEA